MTSTTHAQSPHTHIVTHPTPRLHPHLPSKCLRLQQHPPAADTQLVVSSLLTRLYFFSHLLAMNSNFCSNCSGYNPAIIAYYLFDGHYFSCRWCKIQVRNTPSSECKHSFKCPKLPKTKKCRCRLEAAIAKVLSDNTVAFRFDTPTIPSTEAEWFPQSNDTSKFKANKAKTFFIFPTEEEWIPGKH